MQILSADLLPWERQVGELSHWFQRFDKYAKPLGAEFITRRAYFLYRADNATDPEVLSENALPIWNLMAEEWQWAERAKEFATFESFQLQTLWRKRRMSLLEEDYTMAHQLREYAADALAQLKVFSTVRSVTDPVTGQITIIKRVNFRPVEVAQMAKIGSELGRLAVELPTQIIEGGGPEVGIYLPSLVPASTAVPEPATVIATNEIGI